MLAAKAPIAEVGLVSLSEKVAAEMEEVALLEEQEQEEVALLEEQEEVALLEVEVEEEEMALLAAVLVERAWLQRVPVDSARQACLA